MTYQDRARQQAELIVHRISQNLELASVNSPVRRHNLIRTCEIRKFELYALLSRLRRAEHTPKQQRIILRIKHRLFKSETRENWS